MENTTDFKYYGNLFLLNYAQNSEILQTHLIKYSFAANLTGFDDFFEESENNAKRLIQSFVQKFIRENTDKYDYTEIYCSRYRLGPEDMDNFTVSNLDVSDEFITKNVLPYIEKHQIAPIEEFRLLTVTNSGIYVGKEKLESYNLYPFLRLYRNVPQIIRNILEWLEKRPLLELENKSAILKALKATRLYQENHLSDITDFKKTDWITNYHVLLSNLKDEPEEYKQILSNLIVFQRSTQKNEILNQIWHYRNEPDVTRKQIEICTLNRENILFPNEIYNTVRYTKYYRDYLQNDNIPPAGPEPFHLLLAAMKIEQANQIETNNISSKLYWAVKEDGLKDWIAIKIELLKMVPPIMTYRIDYQLKLLKQDISLAKRKKFYNISSFVEDFERLQEKFSKGTEPFKNAEPESLLNCNVSTENLTNFPVSLLKNKNFVSDCEDSHAKEIFLNGFVPLISFHSSTVDYFTSYCPMEYPIAHWQIKSLAVPNAELKAFTRDFLKKMGYDETAFVVYSNTEKQQIDIYSPNLIQVEGNIHPICTINNYTKARKILLEFELSRNKAQVQDYSCQIQTNLEKYLDNDSPTPSDSKKKGKSTRK